MPTVPANNVVPFPEAQMKPRLVGDTYLMMAAADLHEAGRLFEDRAQPVKDALASGDFDAAGVNSTNFEKATPGKKVISQTVVAGDQ